MIASSLGELTRSAIAAAREGDLDALGRALNDRAAAIPFATPQERARAIEDGETIGRLLAETKRNLAAKYNRLEQLRSGFAAERPSNGIDLKA
jgi:hypothetical protein